MSLAHENLDPDNRQSSKRSSCAVIRCVVAGLLFGGVALAIVITLWLTSPRGTTASIGTFSSSSIAFTVTTITTTSATSTTSASTTSTSTTTTTTPSPPCPAVSVGSSSVIYNASSGSVSTYVCSAFIWTSNITGSVNLTFQFQNLPLYWVMDDVLVHDGNSQMLTNGGFESGVLFPWFRTDPYGPCNGSAGQVSSVLPHTGSFHLLDGSDYCPDFITQSFAVVVGRIYTISFWLQARATGPEITVLVTLF